MKTLHIILMIVICVSFISCGHQQVGNQTTNTKNLLDGGRIVQCYNYDRRFGPEVYVVVIMKGDSLIIEKEVSAGVYYSYYNIIKHEGYIGIF